MSNDAEDIDYEADLRIDQLRLGDEWMEQPSRFMKWAVLYANAQKECDEAKERVELVKARLDNEIRSNYTGTKRLTEGAIDGNIIRDPAYRTAQKAYLEAKHAAEIFKSAVKAFDQRKSALEALVRLMGMEFFSDPKEPNYVAIKREMDETSEAATARIHKRRRG